MTVRGRLTIHGITTQEERVILLSMSGLVDKEIAREMNVALETVRTYWVRIRKKVGGQTRAQLIAQLAMEAADHEQHASIPALSDYRQEIERLTHEIHSLQIANADLESRYAHLCSLSSASPLIAGD